MLIVQGKDLKMSFYRDFLRRLNGTDKAMEALLRLPEMRDSVISGQATAASLTSSGDVLVLPEYKHETVPRTATVRIDPAGRVTVAPGPKPGASGQKEEIAQMQLLRWASLPPKRIPSGRVKAGQGQKAGGTKPRARLLPAIQESSAKEKMKEKERVKEKEKKVKEKEKEKEKQKEKEKKKEKEKEKKEKEEKVLPLLTNRVVDFVARAIEERQKNKQAKKKKQLPPHVLKYLKAEEAKKKRELAESRRRKRSQSATRGKAKGDPKTKRGQQSSSPLPAGRSSARKPSARQSPAGRPARRQPSARQSPARKAPGRPAPAGQPSARQPSAGQQSARPPSARQPSARQPSARQPSARQPSAREPSAREPSARPACPRQKRDCGADLLERMLGQRQGAKGHPGRVQQDNRVPPKRSLSPRTQRVLLQVVTCILGQVARKRRGQRDEQRDLQEKLKCELAVLQWSRARDEPQSSQDLQAAGARPAAQAGPGQRSAGAAQPRTCTEEERQKLWDSLRKKYQQKARQRKREPWKP
ncbi:neurofilament medium polypeptide-like isoform X3 [Apus apus]|uniref:neurofilament medium polypeptide-like isoform X2 n=1 Tax=Apus apus TaxID=8895 RepID=UPI0021F916C4|nr:neurofilament medium polypeptide-like isoform X2 [Apus apus]XP_051491296.1 neurofilament medium polypeptide-like isoform X3 [Apus apus]XP_051491300.1 neurofilament medium polypeptide-like isoform X4 [Apus apus]XP_051491302.1 neurofilament medium polypeptide-like isoform X2 [Apus apus]XP_051491303.1 neurofilament medium polypeptide-like isoform X2 [Apus apus]XP_051491305.1 neurofilament medium polypeptide-like isoform X3 [Apus apus]XP_051491306.1 neurofilament medium polypeptide-like isofor